MNGCIDTFGWTNGQAGKTCADYAQWCDGGTFRVGATWAGGETFNFPERNCCACGGSGAAASPPPPPPSDGVSSHGYATHLGFTCRGADRTAKYKDVERCEQHCAERKCACTHFGKGVCKFTYTYTGILRSAEAGAYTTYVRPGAAAEEEAVKVAERERLAQQVAKTPGLACGGPAPRLSPKFYLYDGPAFMWGERLVACYRAKNKQWPWAMAAPPHAPVGRGGSARNATQRSFFGTDAFLPAGSQLAAQVGVSSLLAAAGTAGGAPTPTPSSPSSSPATVLSESGPAPHADLSHALWLHAALRGNKHRMSEGDSAALYVVPAFGSLSEATGTCEGTTHAERMSAAANALADHPWFAKFPKRHVVFAGATSEDRTPLGELGAALARAGAIGVCTSRERCSARFAKRAEVPMLPLLSLMNPSIHPRLTSEACPRGAAPGVAGASVKRRSTLLFFRGAHGTSLQSQEVTSHGPQPSDTWHALLTPPPSLDATWHALLTPTTLGSLHMAGARAAVGAAYDGRRRHQVRAIASRTQDAAARTL